jgi:inorganic triphosphatase YgiF
MIGAVMGIETELKFRVPQRRLQTLRSQKIPGSTMGERTENDLRSTYFDTPRLKLKRRGLSLRVRKVGDKHVQTIKADAPGRFSRGEWETEVNGGFPDLRKVKGTPLKQIGSKKLRRKLKPIFETSVHRTVVPVHIRASEIELAIDRGNIKAGRRSSQIEEVELELKSGRPADLFHLAKTMEKRSQAELYLRSKSERGYELAQGNKRQAVFAETIELAKNVAAGDAFRTIARSCVRHFADNADAVRASDAEGIHQMRVGLRRLRAAISIFARLLPDRRTERIKAELKWLTDELAPAREIDVFVKKEIHPLSSGVVPRRAGKALEQEFVAKRDSALARASRTVDSARFRALLLDVVAWIEGSHDHSADEASVVASKFASNVLHRRVRNVLKQGKHLAKLSERRRHKVRIRVKKIRYAVEFFESLFPKRRRKALARLSRRLRRIQDALGSLNDLIAHRQMAAAAALHAPRRNRRARAFASGVIVGREEEAAKPLMKVAIREVGKLRHAGRFL